MTFILGKMGNIRIRCDPLSLDTPPPSRSPMQFARVVTVAQPLVFTAVALTIFVQRTEITTSPTISSTSSSCCWSRCYRYYALISKATNDKYDKREKWGRKREKWGKWEREGERAGGGEKERERERINLKFNSIN